MQLKKQITYLKNNNIKYFKLFNIIISLPTTSIHYENLYANKQFREIKFLPVRYDQGAGYAIKIDLEPIMKKLNK